ncbi:hypothetical protein [Pigmentiphaga litoralis]|uniref:hypothetical protein n=1 Tax=Pigmentiphaga litoralis TaxID=516702 RepID=UPI003B438103
MTRTVSGLLALFALVAGACIALGAYFTYGALVAAHRDALESRYVLAAQRVAGTAELAASFGIALPAQTTLTPLIEREARLDASIVALDVLDASRTVLFSTRPDRVGHAATPLGEDVVRPIRNDLGRDIGRAVVHYDDAAALQARASLARQIRTVAIPAALVASLGTLLIGWVLARRLHGRAVRAADPVSWPAQAHDALDDVAAVHARLAARLDAGDAALYGARP